MHKYKQKIASTLCGIPLVLKDVSMHYLSLVQLRFSITTTIPS